MISDAGSPNQDPPSSKQSEEKPNPSQEADEGDQPQPSLYCDEKLEDEDEEESETSPAHDDDDTDTLEDSQVTTSASPVTSSAENGKTLRLPPVKILLPTTRKQERKDQ